MRIVLLLLCMRAACLGRFPNKWLPRENGVDAVGANKAALRHAIEGLLYLPLWHQLHLHVADTHCNSIVGGTGMGTPCRQRSSFGP